MARHAAVPSDEIVVWRSTDGETPRLDRALSNVSIRVRHTEAGPGGARQGHGEDGRRRRIHLLVVPRFAGANDPCRVGVMRCRDPGIHPDVSVRDRRIRDEVDPWPLEQGEVMRPSERQGLVGQTRGEIGGVPGEGHEIVGVEMDDEPVWRQRTVGAVAPTRLHGSLDAALDLDGLHMRAEEACRRALEEAFEEPLEGGQGRHGRWRSLAEGTGAAPRTGFAHAPGVTIRRLGRYPRARAAERRALYSRPVRAVHGPEPTCVPRGTMTEILTESFCERCGTRYTFESARPRTRLKGVKVLSRGLKNFVLSDDTSIDEAMAAARSETDREATSHQLDAFHKTFNFCMSCRQYTCPNCWNEAEARCLSCAPLALLEPATTIDDLRALRDAVVIEEPAWTNGPSVPAVEPWSIPGQPAAGAWATGSTETDETAVDGPSAETGIASTEPVESSHPTDIAQGIEPAASEAADKAAAQTTGLLQRFRPGQSLDAELDAYERELADAQSTGTAAGTEGVDIEPLTAALATKPEPDERSSTAVPEDLGEPVELPPGIQEPEPVAADEPATEEVAAAVTEPIAAAEATEEPAALATEDVTEEPAAPAASGPPPEWTTGADVVEQPTWRITAPDAAAATPPPPAPDTGSVPLRANGAPSDGAGVEPQWPARPQWPAASAPAAGLPFLGRSATPQGGIEALWAASNQEIVTAAPAPGRHSSGIQPCVSCGLSLSATAKFCRRCGTLQGR